MSSLTLAVDFGGSCLKGFFTLDTFKPEVLLMEPEVALVSLQSLEAYEQNKIGNASPENTAWIEYKGKYQAVGFLARKRFHAGLQSFYTGLEERILNKIEGKSPWGSMRATNWETVSLPPSFEKPMLLPPESDPTTNGDS